jgi:adenosylcobinamide amidohydrolase
LRAAAGAIAPKHRRSGWAELEVTAPGVFDAGVNGESPTIVRRDRWLLVRFPGPQRMLSWAIVNGGFRTASTVAWREVALGELGLEVDPQALLLSGLAEQGLPDAVGLLTGCRLDAAVERTARLGDLTVGCVTTVGLGNALRAGDPAAPLPRPVGTINACVWLSRPLTDEALVESQALATEARTLAMLEGGVDSTVSGRPATGTGTDCQVVAAPIAGGDLISFVGKHTIAGQLMGTVVRDAVAEGIARWLAVNSVRAARA